MLLCGHDHHLIHHHGWDVDIGPDGHPRFYPPPSIDPTRTPDRPGDHPPYHVRALEAQGLVALVEVRSRRGLDRAGAGGQRRRLRHLPRRHGCRRRRSPPGGRLSAAYLIALAARAVREVGALVRGAERAGKPLPTLSVDADVRFRSAAERAAFADDLAAAVRTLAARYHDEAAPGGRWYRVVALSHPRPTERKQTMTGTDRVIDLSVEVPGTPEEVWEAIATGPGITSWFIPIEVEEREGGTSRSDWGDFGPETAGRGVGAAPPGRLRGRRRGAGLAYEWLVEAATAAPASCAS